MTGMATTHTGGSQGETAAEERAAYQPRTVLAQVRSGFYGDYGKRVLDILGACTGIALGIVPVVVAGIAMRSDSSGRTFIVQPRMGRGGRVFKMFKLRTMVDDAEKDGMARWASAEDPRVTRVGRLIRRLRIDEFPQFVNVLVGHMSLVGPRPERPELHDQIVGYLPDFANRVAVKPGITGVAQVNDGYAASVDASRRKLGYDLEYIQNQSFWLDLTVMLRTLRVVITGHGSR